MFDTTFSSGALVNYPHRAVYSPLPERRNGDGYEQTNIRTSGNASLIEGAVMGVLALLFGSTFSAIGLGVALASLRLMMMTTAAGALGLTTLGSGYLVVKGGNLVIQAAKPGVIDTIRAANRMARDIRGNALVVYDSAGNAVRGATQAAGNTVSTRIAASREVVNTATGNATQAAIAAFRSGSFSGIWDGVWRQLVNTSSAGWARYRSRVADGAQTGGFTDTAGGGAIGIENLEDGIIKVEIHDIGELRRKVIHRDKDDGGAVNTYPTADEMEDLAASGWTVFSEDLGDAIHEDSASNPEQSNTDKDDIAGSRRTRDDVEHDDVDGDEEEIIGYFNGIDKFDIDLYGGSRGSSQHGIPSTTASYVDVTNFMDG
jgi:hypothetical protein